MGNVLLSDNKKDPVQPYERWLEENPQLNSREIMIDSKLFRTSKFKYNDKSIILKVFFNYKSIDPSNYLRSFNILMQQIKRYHCCHLQTLKILHPTDAKGEPLDSSFIMGVRQYLPYTLQQKLQLHPQLSIDNKNWVIFQIILAIYTLHVDFKLYHGNLRTSNFLLTNYQFMVLTDFATIKPNYILEDTEQGLAQFRLFYESSINKCTLAPQKMTGSAQLSDLYKNSDKLYQLYEEWNKTSQRKMQKYSIVTQITVNVKKQQLQQNKEKKQQIQEMHHQIQNLQRMDLFSLGCIILEILENGKQSLKYQKFLALKKGNFNLDVLIKEKAQNIQHGDEIRQILNGLLKIKPHQRMSINQVLQKWLNIVDQDLYLLFWHCLSAFSKTSFKLPDQRICLLFDILRFIEEQIKDQGFVFTMKKPKCLQNFKALKIFVKMIETRIIASIRMNNSSLLQKIIIKIKTLETNSSIIQSEEIIFQELSQRQSFFNNSSKSRQSLKKYNSFLTKTKLIQDKLLCPPQFNHQLRSLIQSKYQSSHLNSTHQREINRFQNILQFYRNNQHFRQERINEKNRNCFYKNCELIIKIIYACLRGCRYIASKMLGLQMLMLIARDAEDQLLLKTMLPYLISITQDNDVKVAKEAFQSLIDMFYYFIDPFHCEEDAHYFDIFLQFLLANIRISKIRQTIFSRFKQVYSICQWLEVHHRKLISTQKKMVLSKLIEGIRINWGGYSKQQIRCLMENIPETIIPDMFEFYISFLNTQKILGFKSSLMVAKFVKVSDGKQFLEVFDNCMESGLEEMGISLYYCIKYFRIRRKVNQYLVSKIVPHIINPHIWIRQETYQYLKMCLEEFPPSKIFFIFRVIFEPPFPLKPQDLQQQVLLPKPLKENDIDLKEKKICFKNQRKIGLTQQLYSDYLKSIKIKTNQDSVNKIAQTKWNQVAKSFQLMNDINRAQPYNFASSIKKLIQSLYQHNFFYYVGQIQKKYKIVSEDQKDKQLTQLSQALKRFGKFNLNDYTITYEKKQLFLSLYDIINSNFQKFLGKFAADDQSDNLKTSQNILIIGQILWKFQSFQILPTNSLGIKKAIYAPRSEKIFKPKGILISENYEHRDQITAIKKVSPNLFISGSYDGTLRIFNCKNIDNNIITHSIASYEISNEHEEKAKVNSIATFEKTLNAIVAVNKGQVKVYQIQRMSNRMELNNRKMNKVNQSAQILTYDTGGQVEKVESFYNQQYNQCFSYITAQGILGIQDIRTKNPTLICNIGREKGFPQCLTISNNNNSILIGTINGYIINYDIRCNIISSILQLYYDEQPAPLCRIQCLPADYDSYINNIDNNNSSNNSNLSTGMNSNANSSKELYVVNYPSKHYEFAHFNLSNSHDFLKPDRYFTSASSQEQIISAPYLVNKTNQENFRLCNNSLTYQSYYDNLSDFTDNFDILSYISDPLTIKQTRIREIWMENCKYRYNQIYSIYNKRCLPFTEHIAGLGILTNLNPCIGGGRQIKKKQNSLTMLVPRIDVRNSVQFESLMTSKPNNFNVMHFQEEQSSDYCTCACVMPTMIVTGCHNCQLKIYR